MRARDAGVALLVGVLMGGVPGCGDNTISTTMSSSHSPAGVPPVTERIDVRSPGLGGGTGRIAYSCQGPVGGRTSAVCISALDGSALQVLATPSAYEPTPAWSPDGRRIAIRIGVDCTACQRDDIGVMDADGSHLRNLSNDATAPNWGGSWTPDSRHIVYNTGRGAGALEMQLASVDVNNGARSSIATTVWAEYPSVSPDGLRVVVMSNHRGEGGDDDYDIYTASLSGAELVQLTRDRGEDGFAHWSPDGRTILFQSQRDRGRDRSDIYVMRRDGSPPARGRTAPAGHTGHPMARSSSTA